MRFWTQPAALIVAFAAASAAAMPLSAAEPITFTIKFPPGQICRQTTSMEMETTVISSNNPAAQTEGWKSTSKTTLEGIKPDVSGESVQFTYDDMQLAFPNLSKTISDEKDRTLSAIVGAKVMLHFTRMGKVDRVDGVNPILAKLPADSAEDLKPFLNDERIKSGFNERVELLLPNKPVDVGESWETQISRDVSGVNVKVTSRVTLAAVRELDGHRIAKLEFAGKGKVTPPNSGTASKFEIEKYEHFGNAEFDQTRGWFTAQSVDMVIKCSVTANADSPSMKIERTMKYRSKETVPEPPHPLGVSPAKAERSH